MSRGQEGSVIGTADDQNTGYYDQSQNSYSNAQTDASDYQKQLADYASSNPYGAGGADQTATNQQLTNTSDALARSTGQALQSQALRTGGNTSGGVAATEQMEEANDRTLSGDEASATQDRIGKQAGYNQDVLNATAVPVSQQTALSGQQGQLAGQALSTAAGAAKTPSWLDTFGNAVANGLGKTLTQGGGSGG